MTVVLSAYIRLAEVGIGCDDWPACYAQLDGESEKKGVTVLTNEGRDMAHYGARIAHRYIASTLGLFIVITFTMAVKRGSTRRTSLFIPASILCVTVFLSLLGYYTPTRSNPLITMGNLLGGMAMLGLLWWWMQRESTDEGATIAYDPATHRRLALVALVLICSQIVLGGWSSANYASASCPGVIQCAGGVAEVLNPGDAFNPARKIQLDSEGQVIPEPGIAALTMGHRGFALLTAAYLAWLVRRVKHRPSLSSTAVALAIFSASQIVLGVGMIWLQMPLLLLTAHNALAAGLLLSSVNLLHRLTPPAESQLPD